MGCQVAVIVIGVPRCGVILVDLFAPVTLGHPAQLVAEDPPEKVMHRCVPSGHELHPCGKYTTCCIPMQTSPCQ